MSARPSSRAGTAGATAVLLVLAACSGDDAAPTSGWTTALDTLANGAIKLIHTPPPDESPTWTLEPELRIGAMDGTGPDVFSQVAAIDVGPDGRIAVLDAQSQEIRLFAPDGTHLRTFGGKGGGPGEFEVASSVVFGPDGLMRVPDWRNARLSLLHPDSGFVGSHRYQPLIVPFPWGGVVDSTGSTWSLHYHPPQTPAERGTQSFVQLAPDGSPGDTIYPIQPARDDAAVWEIDLGREVTFAGVPNYPSGSQVLDPRLRVWTTPRGDPAYRLIRRTADGDTSLVIEVDRPPAPTDREWADSIVAGYEQRFNTRLDRSKIPDVAPSIRTFFFDDDGRLWVHRHLAADSLRTYDSFHADSGEHIGTLTTGLPLWSPVPPVIRGDTLWGVVRDELDVPTVVRAVLRPATPSA